MTHNRMENIFTGMAPFPAGCYSQAVSSGDLVFVSGQIPIVPATGEVLNGTITEEVTLVIDNIEHILIAAGVGLDRVVKVDVFLSDIAHFQELDEVYSKRFTGEVKPARSLIQSSRLPRGARVEISCIAVRP
jgi:2-iminobutanoate/2-iminopropanoate deaminase